VNGRAGLSLTLLLAAALAGSALGFVGFQGLDDLHYLQAAERMASGAVYVPGDHWEARLPYVALLAAGLRGFGVTQTALVAPGAAVLLALLLGCAALGRKVLPAGGALWAVAVPAATPLLLRSPSVFYPDALEAALAVAGIALALWAFDRPGGWARTATLFAAGLLMGGAVLTRETAIAAPVGLGGLFMLRRGGAGWRDAIVLALGVLLPVAAESAHYAFLTGDPLFRLHLDARGATVLSDHLEGGSYTGASPLFNFTLAARWAPPSALRLHWSVNALLNFFTSPAWALVPWLGLAGAARAWRDGGAARDLACLALGVLGLQYVIDTFVIALPPAPRYFIVAGTLLAVLAGYRIARLRPAPAAAVFGLLVLLPAAIVAAAPVGPGPAVAALRRLAPAGEPVFVSRKLADAAALAGREDPAFGARLLVGAPPPGGLAAIGWEGWPEDTLSARCADGGGAWDVLARTAPAGGLSALLRSAGVAGLLPAAARLYLDRPQAALTLARRRC
jgi:4-amino-4-deoxy-L-arabinose transferase-like glycosyltransferase